MQGGADGVITITKAHRNPYFNMVKRNINGSVSLVIPPEAPISRRQDGPEVFDVTTVAYVVNPNFVISKDSLFQGLIGAIEVPPERAVDIDTLDDFKIAEYYLEKLR
jgi:N-acylneuraminate cytidylyltransferase